MKAIKSSQTHSQFYGTIKNPNGPTYKVASNSIIRSVDDKLEEFQHPKLMEIGTIIKDYSLKFLQYFYKNTVNGNRTFTRDDAEAFKSRSNDLDRLIKASTLDDAFCFMTVVIKYNDTSFKTINPGSSELRYLSKRFSVIYQDEEGEVVDVYTTESKPKYFNALMLGAIKSLSILEEIAEDYYRLPAKELIYMLVSVSHIFYYMNPIGDDLQSYFEESFERLTKEGLGHDPRTIAEICNDESLIESGIIFNNFPELLKDDVGKLTFQELWNDTMDELRNYKFRPWNASFLNSLKKMQEEYPKEFLDSDYMFSSKSSPGKVYIRGRLVKEAYLKSAAEDDPLAGCLFDQITNYVSGFEHSEKLKINSLREYIMTILINCPNKYKPRVIHLLCAWLSQRMYYFHNRSSYRHKYDRWQVTKDHDIGREFARFLTSYEFRMSDVGSEASIMSFDWSDATDNVPWDLQLEVIRLKFGEELAECWEYLLNLEREFKIPNSKKSLPYVCKGISQPQGSPDSFEEFSDLAEILWIVTYRFMNPFDVYDVSFHKLSKGVGDDAIAASPGDPNARMATFYSALCYWAGIPVNVQKSVILTPQDVNWRIEFAKVTSQDGEYLNPVPPRLLLRYADPDNESYLFGTLLYQAKYGTNNKATLFKYFDELYGEASSSLKVIINAGWIPGYAVYKDPDYVESDDDILVKLLYAINLIKSSLVDTLMSESAKLKWLRDSDGDLKYLVNYFHSEKEMEYILENIGPNHMLHMLLDKPIKLNRYLRLLFSSNSQELLENWYSAVPLQWEISPDEGDMLCYIIEAYHYAITNGFNIADFPQLNMYLDLFLKPKLKVTDRIREKSLSRSSQQKGIVFRNISKDINLMLTHLRECAVS